MREDEQLRKFLTNVEILSLNISPTSLEILQKLAKKMISALSLEILNINHTLSILESTILQVLNSGYF